MADVQIVSGSRCPHLLKSRHLANTSLSVLAETDGSLATRLAVDAAIRLGPQMYDTSMLGLFEGAFLAKELERGTSDYSVLVYLSGCACVF